MVGGKAPMTTNLDMGGNRILNVQVRFINFIPMQFFHKSLHTP